MVRSGLAVHMAENPIRVGDRPVAQERVDLAHERRAVLGDWPAWTESGSPQVIDDAL